MSKKFEYLIEVTSKSYTPDLSKLGIEGWELVAVVSIQTEVGFQDYKYFFKREIKQGWLW